MKILMLILFFLSSAIAEEAEQLRAVVRIERSGETIHLIKVDDNKVIPAVFQSETAKAVLRRLPERAEALITGHIVYQRSHEDSSRFDPWFVIDEAKPVSLSLIGEASAGINEPQVFLSKEEVFVPASIPITTEAASAMTLTGTLLLMNALTMNPDTDPAGRRDLRNALFLSAGTMATLYFIYQQARGKSKP